MGQRSHELLGVPVRLPLADWLGVLAVDSSWSNRDSDCAMEVGCALVARRAAPALAGLAVHCRHAVSWPRPHRAHPQAFHRVHPVLLPRVFLAEPGAAGLAY